jgi:glutathione synthase
MSIYQESIQKGVSQTISLGLHRSDYMLHNIEGDRRTLMQVELNTIAASFGSLSSKVFKRNH